MTSHLHRIATTAPAPARPRRAIVLGGSLAGLLAARVLADHVDEVVVVDRDPLDGDLSAPRRGVPQGRHTHGLLVSGAEGIEAIVPGFRRAVLARGALEADVLARSRWLISDHLLSDAASGMPGLLCSRTLIESQVRRLVAAVPGITLVGDHDVVGLLADPGRTRVIGARVASRTPAASPAPGAEDLLGDVVVDATGRGSRAGVWVAHLGFPTPQESVVAAGVSYVTRLFEDRKGVLDHLDCDVVGGHPSRTTSGVALRQEGGRWTVTLAAHLDGEPPADLDGFLAYARALPTDGIARIVEACTPVGEPQRFRYPASRWRHWESVSRRPEGFVVLGDAVSSFNPVYGQGMSSAVLQVLALRRLLAEGGLTDLAARSAAAFAHVVATPWALATGADRRYPSAPRKPLPERLLDRYVDRVVAVASQDPAVTLAFGRVLNLLAAPPSLLAPAVAWKVLGPGSRRAVRAARRAQARRTAATTQRVRSDLAAVPTSLPARPAPTPVKPLTA